MADHKKCRTCKQVKLKSEFYVRTGTYLSPYCKPCDIKKRMDYEERNKDKVRLNQRNGHLLRRYGITLEQYEELHSKQNGQCAICNRKEEEFHKKLSVDHNHKTGEIRGLLCNHCNHWLVGKHTDGDLMRKIANYLDQGTGLYVPEKPKKRKQK
jgi:hypothetical protein